MVKKSQNNGPLKAERKQFRLLVISDAALALKDGECVSTLQSGYVFVNISSKVAPQAMIRLSLILFKDRRFLLPIFIFSKEMAL